MGPVQNQRKNRAINSIAAAGAGSEGERRLFKAACLLPGIRTCSGMGLPSQPVTLSVEQLDELNHKLASMRHDINNHLSLIMAAVELIRYKPQMADRMMVTLSEQPPKITESLRKFSAEF